MRRLKDLNNEQKIERAFMKYLKIKADAYDQYLKIDIDALAKYTKLRDKLERN